MKTQTKAKRTISTHEQAGKWYEHNGALRYHPRFPVVTDDNETLNVEDMKCFYAGYKIIDTIEQRNIDGCAPDRWQAVRSAKLGKGETFEAQTKSLVMEMVDRHYTGDRPRTYVHDCKLRHHERTDENE